LHPALVIKEMLYHYVAPFKIGSFHATAANPADWTKFLFLLYKLFDLSAGAKNGKNVTGLTRFLFATVTRFISVISVYFFSLN
jgi:hypothetical protein